MGSNRRRKNKPTGFTLVELLVVVAIISLLMVMLLPALAAARETSKRTACAANLRSLYVAMTYYAQDNQNKLPNLGPLSVMMYGYFNSYWDTTTGKGMYAPRNFFSTYLGIPNDKVVVKQTLAASTYPDYVGHNLLYGRPKVLVCPSFNNYGTGYNRLNYCFYSGSAVANSDATGPTVEYGVSLEMLHNAAMSRRTGGVRRAPAGSSALIGDKIFRVDQAHGGNNTGGPQDTCHLYNAGVTPAGALIPVGGNVVVEDGSVQWYKYTGNQADSDCWVTPSAINWGSQQYLPFNTVIINTDNTATNRGGVNDNYTVTNNECVIMGSGNVTATTAGAQRYTTPFN